MFQKTHKVTFLTRSSIDNHNLKTMFCSVNETPSDVDMNQD